MSKRTNLGPRCKYRHPVVQEFRDRPLRNNGVRPGVIESLTRPGDVLAALRGPDSDYSNTTDRVLKRVVTTRIRSIVFTSYPGDYTTRKLTLSDIADVKHATANRQATHHFAKHLIKAIDNTSSKAIWGGLAQQLIYAIDGQK